jgi:hypothetical protein
MPLAYPSLLVWGRTQSSAPRAQRAWCFRKLLPWGYARFRPIDAASGFVLICNSHAQTLLSLCRISHFASQSDVPHVSISQVNSHSVFASFTFSLTSREGAGKSVRTPRNASIHLVAGLFHHPTIIHTCQTELAIRKKATLR